MEICRFCLEEITQSSTPYPYHSRCVKKLFGVSWIPKIPFGVSDLPALVMKVEGKMSISGVQIKVSAGLNT